MRARHRNCRGTGVRLLAATAVLALAAACSGTDPDQLEASQASPEPTTEPPASSESTVEPSEPEPSEPDPEPEPTIGEDEPLYAPLPELTPDPDNDVPDDLEQLILDSVGGAIEVEAQAYAAAAVDGMDLSATHVRDAEQSVVSWVETLQDQGLVERTPDTEFSRIFVREHAAGVAIVRECFAPGPRSGMYDGQTGRLREASPEGAYARDRMLELLGAADEEPTYRVVRVEYSDTEGCER